MKLIPILAAALLASPCCAQTGGGAQVFSGKDVASQMTALVQKAKASGSSGGKLADYGSHAIQLSVRTKSGGAEVLPISMTSSTSRRDALLSSPADPSSTRKPALTTKQKATASGTASRA